jgi:ribonuclease H-related protein
MAKKKYYAYTVGKEKGVVDNWTDCERIVSGVPGAKFKGFVMQEEAEKWLDAGADYSIKHIGLEQGIYFDAGTGAGNGVEISVTDENGDSLLHKVMPDKEINDRGFYLITETVTNNYGELLACKYALQIATTESVQKIFGDSKLVIEYWSKGYLKKDTVAPKTIELADEVKSLRKKFEKMGGIMSLISGSSNPADLGFHKG